MNDAKGKANADTRSHRVDRVRMRVYCSTNIRKEVQDVGDIRREVQHVS